MSRIPLSALARTILIWITIALLILISVACAGNRSEALRVHADMPGTTAGGAPITLSLSAPPELGPIVWHISPLSPGKLDSASGGAVRYLPPAASTITSEVEILIIATAGNFSSSVTIYLQPSIWSMLDEGA